MSIARATISGVLVSEPEKRFTPNNFAVTNFTLQVTPNGRNETPFQVRVTCWRGLADSAAEQLHTGDNVVVEGRLQVHQFESPTGVARRTYEIDASNVSKGVLQPLSTGLEGAGEGGGNRQQPQQQRQPMPQQPQQAPNFDSAFAGTTSQQQQPVGVGAPFAAAPSGNNESFSQEDLLTEDDIPF